MEDEIDQHKSDTIRKKIDQLIALNPVKILIFDFKKTSFMDSSGIGIVMGRYRLMKELGGKVGIINASNQLGKVLKLSGIYKIVNEYDNLEQAIQSLR